MCCTNTPLWTGCYPCLMQCWLGQDWDLNYCLTFHGVLFKGQEVFIWEKCANCFLWMKSGAYALAFETRIRKYLSKNKRRSEEQIHFTAFQAFQSGVYLGVRTLWECSVGFCLNGYTWELKGKRHQNCERLYWLSAIMLFLTERE